MLKKRQKCLFLILFMFLNSMAFANGRCDRLEKEIMKNPNVSKVGVGQHDKWSKEIYFADIYLKNDGYLLVDEFDRYLSGDNINVLYIGRDAEGKIECEFVDFGINCRALTGLFNKEIRNVNDIINNYDEIYKLAAELAKETPEERSKRRNRTQTQDDQNFTDKLGNFENDECWGQVFAQTFSLDNYMGRGEPLFADE